MSLADAPVRAVRAEDAFDVGAVHAWLAWRVPGWFDLVGRDLPRVGQFAGGSSNLTFLLDYGRTDVVLRRPPHGHRAASAHDMGREVRVQQRLRPHLDVVPEIFGYCTDESVIGAEFYVMERLRGTILTGPRLPDGLALDERGARALGETAFDSLADLHSIDVDVAGLADLGRGQGYVGRQVSGWSRRYRAALTDDVPDAEALMAWLDGNRPDDVAARLLHGDWRLDNLLLDLSELSEPSELSAVSEPAAGGRPRVTGILDWEMATVGDPLMDLGSALAYWVQADDDAEFGLMQQQPSRTPGMPSRGEIVARYLARTGVVLPPVGWAFYEVFGLFRLAVIVQQIWARYRSGATTNPRFAAFGDVVRMLVRRAERLAG